MCLPEAILARLAGKASLVTRKTFVRIFGYTESVLRLKPVRKPGQDMREFPTYSLPEAALFLQIPERTLRAWFAGKNPILTPAAMVGSFPILSFRDLVDAHILHAARVHHNVPMARIRAALELTAKEGSRYPLQDENLRIFARYLVRIEPGRGRRKRAVLNLSTGQTGIPQVIDLYTKRIVKDEHGSPIAIHPWRDWQTDSRSRPVSISPDVMSGRLVVRGTRIPVTILAVESRSKSPEILARKFRISPKVVREALRHFENKAA